MSQGPIRTAYTGPDSDVNPMTPAKQPPRTVAVSPLDKHAHLRRTVDGHHQALQVHQTVLQKHAELHQVQARARDAMKREHDERLRIHGRAIARIDCDVAVRRERDRTFLGRLRWLFTGR